MFTCSYCVTFVYFVTLALHPPPLDQTLGEGLLIFVKIDFISTSILITNRNSLLAFS